MNIFVFGSSIVSSYWNGAATYYRGCYKYLARRGHSITFAEPDIYGRQQHRDEGDFSYVHQVVYKAGADIDEMLARASCADIVVKHSGVGADDRTLERRVLECRPLSSVVFWDVDAPATLERVESDPADPFRPLIPQYDAILTYGGGPQARDRYLALGARKYASIYNALDPESHFPVRPDPVFACDLAFVGNRMPDRERRVEELFLRAAELAPGKSFLLGGEGWGAKPMPPNVRWIGHVPTAAHNRINCSAGMVLNINRESMASFGFSPPTRIFEAAGAAASMLTDDWPGIESFFAPGKEILPVRNAEEIAAAIGGLDPGARRQMGARFRSRALQEHTYAQRAGDVEQIFTECAQLEEPLTPVRRRAS